MIFESLSKDISVAYSKVEEISMLVDNHPSDVKQNQMNQCKPLNVPENHTSTKHYYEKMISSLEEENTYLKDLIKKSEITSQKKERDVSIEIKKL